jgi:hypothetical protein
MTTEIQTQAFTDAKGQSWLIDFTVDELKRCKKMLEHNPLDLFDQEMTFAIKLADPEYLVDLLWVVLLPTIEEKKLTPESFARLFKGDSLLQARRALAVAIANFFQEAQRREAALAMVRKVIGIEAAILAKLDPLTEAVNSLDESQLASAAYDSLMNGQESSESTPAPSP